MNGGGEGGAGERDGELEASSTVGRERSPVGAELGRGKKMPLGETPIHFS